VGLPKRLILPTTDPAPCSAFEDSDFGKQQKYGLTKRKLWLNELFVQPVVHIGAPGKQQALAATSLSGSANG